MVEGAFEIEFYVFLSKITYLAKSKRVAHCTEVHFASFLSGGFITAIVVNPPERKLAKRTSVHCSEKPWNRHKADLLQNLIKLSSSLREIQSNLFCRFLSNFQRFLKQTHRKTQYRLLHRPYM